MHGNMFRRAAIGLGLVGATAAASLVAAAPANAGPYCAAGYHCVFITSLGSAQHSYFNSDTNFTDDYFTNGSNVNDNVWSASNSSTGGYESHYYYDINYGGGLVFCVNPGHAVEYTQLTTDGIAGNHAGQRDEASSLRLRPTTPISCF
ncbi:hypothetical protein [Amycolatopsis sp. NPDC021455]|uniref:hypothetical protein n=1 Tax=Amycolatopsis sp. NPDC021455 TaxID=3154901 RepID=UPI0033BFDA37